MTPKSQFITKLAGLFARAGRASAQPSTASPSATPAPPLAPGLTLYYPEFAPLLPPDQASGILAEVAPYTMVHTSGIEFAMAETIRLIQGGVEGAIVECGTWRGGSSLAMLMAQRAVFGSVLRPVLMLDSFRGLPPVSDRDGPLAQDWQAGAQPDKFLDNCQAAEAEVRETAANLGFTDNEARIVPGWFRDTLPSVVEMLQGTGIALLRLDGDWYDSTLECLEQLEPLVTNEGTVIVDDYYAWDGCARAVHDYLSRRDLPYRIKSLYGNYGMYFVKRPFRSDFEQF